MRWSTSISNKKAPLNLPKCTDSIRSYWSSAIDRLSLSLFCLLGFASSGQPSTRHRPATGSASFVFACPRFVCSPFAADKSSAVHRSLIADNPLIILLTKQQHELWSDWFKLVVIRLSCLVKRSNRAPQARTSETFAQTRIPLADVFWSRLAAAVPGKIPLRPDWQQLLFDV